MNAQGRDDSGAAPGGRAHRAAMLRDENHSGLCCGNICRCFHQGRTLISSPRKIIELKNLSFTKFYHGKIGIIY